jgi:predicted esterase
VRTVLALLCLAGAALAAAPPADEAHGHGRLLAHPHAPATPARTRGLMPLGLGAGRDGLLFVPASYDPARPAALLVLLHGAGGRAEKVFGHFRDAAERAGVIVLVPESRDQTWDIVVHRAYGADVAFIDQAIEHVLGRYNVDPARIAVGGFSDGASYALSIGLGNGNLFRRVVALSPGFAAPPQLDGKPRVFVAHGTADHILPIDESSRQLVRAMRERGYDVRYLEFDDDHLIRDDIVDAAFAFLAEK